MSWVSSRYQATCRQTPKCARVGPSNNGMYMIYRRERNDPGSLYHKALGRRAHTKNVVKARVCFYPWGREGGNSEGFLEEVVPVGWWGLGFVGRIE